MAEYLTEMAYMRWLKQYFINMQIYFDTVGDLRIRLARYAAFPAAENLEIQIGEIERKLEEATPRNFSLNAKPLQGGQKFLENIKVFINLILHLFKKEPHFSGIYHQEKERIKKIHHEFDFKERLQEVEFELSRFEGYTIPLPTQEQTVLAG